jgi:hypothetical protein
MHAHTNSQVSPLLPGRYLAVGDRYYSHYVDVLESRTISWWTQTEDYIFLSVIIQLVYDVGMPWNIAGPSLNSSVCHFTVMWWKGTVFHIFIVLHFLNNTNQPGKTDQTEAGFGKAPLSVWAICSEVCTHLPRIVSSSWQDEWSPDCEWWNHRFVW